jgi:hypothetical protein
MALAPLARFPAHRRHTGATEPLRRFRHEVISVTHNEAAKIALGSFRDVDLFVIDYKAPEQTRKQKVAWLRVNYPRAKIVALNPSRDELFAADYNIVLNDHGEWFLLSAGAAS